jgi:AcrR family transcriptional regulator
MKDKNKLGNPNAEKILKTAWLLFQKKGFRGVSMDELCLQCNISKPTLYYYFNNKEDLFVQVLLRKLEGIRAAIEISGTIEERLKQVARVVLENFQTEYTGLVHDREHIKKKVNQEKIRDAFRNEMFDPLTALMESGVKSGVLVNEDVHSLTLVFLGIINNFIGRAAELKIDQATLAENLTRYFLKGVSNRG